MQICAKVTKCGHYFLEKAVAPLSYHLRSDLLILSSFACPIFYNTHY